MFSCHPSTIGRKIFRTFWCCFLKKLHQPLFFAVYFLSCWFKEETIFHDSSPWLYSNMRKLWHASVLLTAQSYALPLAAMHYSFTGISLVKVTDSPILNWPTIQEHRVSQMATAASQGRQAAVWASTGEEDVPPLPCSKSAGQHCLTQRSGIGGGSHFWSCLYFHPSPCILLWSLQSFMENYPCNPCHAHQLIQYECQTSARFQELTWLEGIGSGRVHLLLVAKFNKWGVGHN